MDKAVKEYLDKIPRNDKIDQLVNQVDGWDLSSLLNFVQDTLRDRYESMCDDDLDDEYYMSNDYAIDSALMPEPDDEVIEAGCQCPSLFLMGHEDGCPDKRS
jgi:hypothetical protein